MTFFIHFAVVLAILDIRKFIVAGNGYVMGMVQSHNTYSNKNKKIHKTIIYELLSALGVAVIIALISSTVVASVESTAETKKTIQDNVDARVKLYESAFK